MARPLPAGFSALINQSEVPLAILVEIEWPGTLLRVWNGYHELTWNSKTWLGIGHLGGISEVNESSDLSANGITLSLSGIPSARVSEALNDNTQGLPGRVYLGVLPNNMFTVDPLLFFDGIIDVPTIDDDGQTATISVLLEKEFIDNRSGASRYTHQDQLFLYPGDLGLIFLAGIIQKTFTWGKETIYPTDTSSEDVQPGYE